MMNPTIAKQIADLEDEVSFHQDRRDAAASELSQLKMRALNIETSFLGSKIALARKAEELSNLKRRNGVMP